MLTKLHYKHNHTLQLAPNIFVSFIGLIKRIIINHYIIFYIIYRVLPHFHTHLYISANEPDHLSQQQQFPGQEPCRTTRE